MPNSTLIKAKLRPSAPPPPPPPSKSVREAAEKRQVQGESRRQALPPPKQHHPSTTACDAHLQRRSGASSDSVCYQARSTSNTTYEVYHINQQHHTLGIPCQPPRTSTAAVRLTPFSSYSYYPHQTHSSSQSASAADFSQGSNTPATPDSLDSLVGSGEEEDDKSDDACSSDRLQCTSSVFSPVSTTESVEIDNDNNNTIKRAPQRPASNGNHCDQRDNLIEELTSLIVKPYPPPSRCPTSSRVSSAASSNNNDQMSSRSSSTTSSSDDSNGGALSSSLTPSTVVTSKPLPGERPHYYFEGDRPQQPTSRENYEQLSSTMLRRSSSAQNTTLQSRCHQPRSVGHTPPLPTKHYMPLKAYRDESSRLRRSTPQIHYATELVLTPQQAHQIQQSLVNRYATIGRNYHINVGCDQTAVKADVHYRHQQPPQPQPPKPYRSGDNLAMRINNNLISQPSMVMNERSHHHHHHHEAPLTDVRKLQEVSTPPTLSMTSKLNTVPLSSSEDILSADSTTECCDEDGRLSPDDDPEVPKEEEEVRKHTLLSTLVMPRPQRKPPFTIEAAMNKLLGRSKKNASPDASPKLKPSNNGSRRKSSPVAPKKQQQPLPAVNTRDGKSSGGSSCSSSSMVTTLRRAGSDREPPSHFQRGSEDLSDEEATVPDSDSEVMKKPPPPVPSSISSIANGGNGSLQSKETSSSPGALRKRSRRGHRRRKRPVGSEDDDEDNEEDTPEHEMEYCDPCYCYGKCCLDMVASIFCVSLL